MGNVYTYADVEQAGLSGFDDGYREGKASTLDKLEAKLKEFDQRHPGGDQVVAELRQFIEGLNQR